MPLNTITRASQSRYEMGPPSGNGSPSTIEPSGQERRTGKPAIKAVRFYREAHVIEDQRHDLDVSDREPQCSSAGELDLDSPSHHVHTADGWAWEPEPPIGDFSESSERNSLRVDPSVSVNVLPPTQEPQPNKPHSRLRARAGELEFERPISSLLYGQRHFSPLQRLTPKTTPISSADTSGLANAACFSSRSQPCRNPAQDPPKSLPSPALASATQRPLASDGYTPSSLQIDLDPCICLTSSTVHHILDALVPSCSSYQWYDPGNLDSNQMPTKVKSHRYATAQVIFVALCWRQHWLFIRYNPRTGIVDVYNSLRSHIPAAKLEEKVHQLGDALGGTYVNVRIASVAQQVNGYDCGIHVILFALYAAAGVKEVQGRNATLWRLILQRTFTDHVSEELQLDVLGLPQQRLNDELNAAVAMTGQLLAMARSRLNGDERSQPRVAVSALMATITDGGRRQKDMTRSAATLERLSHIVRDLQISLRSE